MFRYKIRHSANIMLDSFRCPLTHVESLKGKKNMKSICSGQKRKILYGDSFGCGK